MYKQKIKIKINKLVTYVLSFFFLLCFDSSSSFKMHLKHVLASNWMNQLEIGRLNWHSVQGFFFAHIFFFFLNAKNNNNNNNSNATNPDWYYNIHHPVERNGNCVVINLTWTSLKVLYSFAHCLFCKNLCWMFAFWNWTHSLIIIVWCQQHIHHCNRWAIFNLLPHFDWTTFFFEFHFPETEHVDIPLQNNRFAAMQTRTVNLHWK